MNAEYLKLVEKRKAILAEMEITEERLQELTAEMVECAMEIKKAREELREDDE